MLGIEDVLKELSGELETNEKGLPPGFRFHPTDEELITFYLASKVFNSFSSSTAVDISEVDLNRCEPWELPEVAKMGEREWYFFSLRDRKYPTGLRTNRATGAGYWKATGKDRQVYNQQLLIGMKKTLVFYKGRAPRGEKTKWVMHEYRLDGHFSCRHSSKEEWVICRIYHKSGDKKNPLFQGRQGYHLLESCLPKLLETNPTTDTATTTCDNTANTNSSISPPNNATALLDQDYHNNPIQALLQCPNYYNVVNHQQENDLKAFINKYNNNNNASIVSQSHHHLFPINGLQLVQATSFSPPRDTTTSISSNSNNMNPSESAGLLKSLLSNQDHYYYCSNWKEQPSSSTITTVQKQCKTESDFSHFQPQTTTQAHDHQPQQVSYDHYHQNPNMLYDQMNDYGQYVLGLSSVHQAVYEMSTSLAFNRSTFHSNNSDPLTKLSAESSWPLDA